MIKREQGHDCGPLCAEHGDPRDTSVDFTRRVTSWRVDGKAVDVEIPVSGSTQAARRRYEQNSHDQAERYGFAPPSYTAFSAQLEDDEERDRR